MEYKGRRSLRSRSACLCGGDVVVTINCEPEKVYREEIMVR